MFEYRDMRIQSRDAGFLIGYRDNPDHIGTDGNPAKE